MVMLSTMRRRWRRYQSEEPGEWISGERVLLLQSPGGWEGLGRSRAENWLGGLMW